MATVINCLPHIGVVIVFVSGTICGAVGLAIFTCLKTSAQ